MQWNVGMKCSPCLPYVRFQARSRRPSSWSGAVLFLLITTHGRFSVVNVGGQVAKQHPVHCQLNWALVPCGLLVSDNHGESIVHQTVLGSLEGRDSGIVHSAWAGTTLIYYGDDDGVPHRGELGLDNFLSSKASPRSGLTAVVATVEVENSRRLSMVTGSMASSTWRCVVCAAVLRCTVERWFSRRSTRPTISLYWLLGRRSSGTNIRARTNFTNNWTRKEKKKELVLVLASSRFTRGLCMRFIYMLVIASFVYWNQPYLTRQALGCKENAEASWLLVRTGIYPSFCATPCCFPSALNATVTCCSSSVSKGPTHHALHRTYC